MSRMIRVLLLSGSLANPSHTRCNVDFIGHLLTQAGVHTDMWDPTYLPLPLHDPVDHRDPHASPSCAVRELAALAEDADAFVWATPVYHNSYSGVLKNALDNLNIRQFRNKPVALISNGGDRSGVQPCDQLRIVARGLLAVAIPSQVVTVAGDFRLTPTGYVIVNPEIIERFTRTTLELVTFATALRELGELHSQRSTLGV